LYAVRRTARLEAQAGAMDADLVERLIFRAAAPIVHSVAGLTDAQRGELLPNIVRVMLVAFLASPGRDHRFTDNDAGRLCLRPLLLWFWSAAQCWLRRCRVSPRCERGFSGLCSENT
jgi:hypothetical protein